MSTKTTIKRIALIAASALGLGLLNVVPASATATVTVGSSAFTMTDASKKTLVGVSASSTFSVTTGSATQGEILTYSLSVTSAPTGSIMAVSGATASSSAPSSGVAKLITGVADSTGDFVQTAGTDSLIDTIGATPTDLSAEVRGQVSIKPDVPGDYVITVTVTPSEGDGTGPGTARSATFTVTATSATSAGLNNWNSNSVLDCESGYTSTEALGCTGIVGGKVVIDVNAVTLADRSTTPDYYIEVTGASITAVDTTTGGDDIDFGYGSNVVDATTTTLDWPTASTNQGVDADGLITVHSDGTAPTAGEEAFTISSASAGTSTITMWYYGSAGQKITFETHKVTWLAGATIGVSADNSSMGVVGNSGTSASNDNGDCNATELATASGNASTDRSELAASVATSLYAYRTADSNTAGQARFVCLVLRDGNGALIDAASGSVITATGGSLAAGGSASMSRAVTGTGFTQSWSAPSGKVATGIYAFQIFGDELTTGPVTFTATIVDTYANVITKTATITFYGKPASISISQAGYAGALGDDTWEAADYSGSDKYKGAAAYVTVKDAGGNTFSQTADGSTFGIGASSITVDSAAVSGTPAARQSDTTQVTATHGTATVSLAKAIFIDCSAATTAQKLTLSIGIKDKDGAWLTSNSVDYYCSDSASTVSVTPSETSAEANSTITVNVSVKDENGFPVADGTAVTVAASQGGVVAGGSSSTTNGAFATAKNVIVGNGGSSMTIAAYVGSKSGTATVAVSGAASSDAADAANEATDAANAATDAANAAAEAADAATAAAQDAQAAVAELATKVASLMAGIKAQITSLTNLVIKIQKKVRA